MGSSYGTVSWEEVRKSFSLIWLILVDTKMNDKFVINDKPLFSSEFYWSEFISCMCYRCDINSTRSSPREWFICDDNQSSTRFLWDDCDIYYNIFYLFYLPAYRSASWRRFCIFVDLAYEFVELMDLAF
jgi:hypothetical protein